MTTLLPFQPANNTVKISLVASLAGQEVVSYIHMQKSAAVVAGDLPLLLADILAWYNGVFRAELSSLITLQRIDAVDLTTESGPVDSINGGSSPGLDATGSVPNNVALVITSRTAQRGRSFRGRTYVGGMGQNSVLSTVEFKPTIVTSMVSHFNALIDPANFHTFIPVVVSRFDRLGRRNDCVTTPITIYTADNRMDSQRRRLEGRGR